MVFNTTLINISVIRWRKLDYPEKITDLYKWFMLYTAYDDEVHKSKCYTVKSFKLIRGFQFSW